MKPRERVTEYLGRVCAEVRCSEVHRDLRLELEGHIEEIIEAEIRAGATEEEAIETALACMGDPLVVGTSLNRVHSPRVEWSLLGMMAGFVVMAIIVMYAVQSYFTAATDYPVVLNTMIGAAVGMAGAVALYFMDYRVLRKVGPWIFGGATLLLAFPRVGEMRVLAAATPYPMVLGAAVMFNKHKGKAARDWAVLIGVAMVPVLLLMRVPLPSTAGLYLVTIVTMLLYTQRDKGRVFAMAVGVGLLMVVLLSASMPYAWARLSPYLNPRSNPDGYTHRALLTAIEQGGPFGYKGPAATMLIPEPHTDFVLTYLIYEYGWVVGAGVIVLAVLFVYRLARSCGAIRETVGRTITLGITALLAVQFGGSIMVSLGLAPTMSITFPFLSYSLVYMVVNMMAVGLVMGIYRMKDMISYSAEATNGEAA